MRGPLGYRGCGGHPSSVSAFGRSTFSLRGRKKTVTAGAFICPLAVTMLRNEALGIDDDLLVDLADGSFVLALVVGGDKNRADDLEAGAQLVVSQHDAPG